MAAQSSRRSLSIGLAGCGGSPVLATVELRRLGVRRARSPPSSTEPSRQQILRP